MIVIYDYVAYFSTLILRADRGGDIFAYPGLGSPDTSVALVSIDRSEATQHQIVLANHRSLTSY